MLKSILTGIAIFSIAAVTAAYADNDQGPGQLRHDHDKGISAPEMDPASALAALTLLAGSLAVVRGRRVKK